MPRTARDSLHSGPSRAGTVAYLVAIYAALSAYMWLVLPTGWTVMIAIGAVVIVAFMIIDPWRRGESLDSLGMTFRHLAAAVRVVIGPAAALALILILMDILFPGHGRMQGFLKRFGVIIPWAFLQQSLLQATFNRRLQMAFRPGMRTSAANGLFFAGMHLPGVLLTAMTFAAGTWWSRLYQKRANLWLPVLVHALLSAAAQTFLPASWTHGFRVGPSYFRWHD